MVCPAKCLLVSLSSNEIAIVFPPLMSIIVCTLVHDMRWFVPTSVNPLTRMFSLGFTVTSIGLDLKLESHEYGYQYHYCCTMSYWH